MTCNYPRQKTSVFDFIYVKIPLSSFANALYMLKMSFLVPKTYINAQESYHGFPEYILDGIFAEQDKKVENACPYCGCTCKTANKKEDKEKRKKEARCTLCMKVKQE